MEAEEYALNRRLRLVRIFKNSNDLVVVQKGERLGTKASEAVNMGGENSRDEQEVSVEAERETSE